MAGDDHALATGSTGDDCDDLDRREAGFGDLAQQAELAQRQVIGQLLDDVRDVVELDQLHRWRCSPNTLWTFGMSHDSSAPRNGSSAIAG